MKGGRYVQGGGCLTVGVDGLVQSGGFGSFSKNYGLAAASLIEAEIVTADGEVRIANECTNPDLFWSMDGQDFIGRVAENAFGRRIPVKHLFVGVEKASQCLAKDREALLAFYDFPADHWKHLRTSNPIESTITTVRHRTIRSKGCLSNKTALAVVFTLVDAAQKSGAASTDTTSCPSSCLVPSSPTGWRRGD